jgi:formimidoylglutamate deiminase
VDALVLDADAPAMVGATSDDALDRWVFGGNRPLVREVYVGGRRVVAEGCHPQREAAAAAYAATLRRLLSN